MGCDRHVFLLNLDTQAYSTGGSGTVTATRSELSVQENMTTFWSSM